MTMNVAIAVPVRNEGAHLPRLLQALAQQAAAPAFALFLFFDGCTDGGPALAATLAKRLALTVQAATVDRAGPANAGLARRRACALALRATPGAHLLTTDADSVPAPDWVAASLAGLATADIVAGLIVPENPAGSPMQQRLGRYLDRLHRYRRALDPVPWDDERTHHWTSAASLAFGPGVYSALDGFAPLARGEDADLCDRAWRAGVPLRRDGRVRVTTSARRDGRVADGFAGMLAALDDADAAPIVAHPEDEAWRYRRHAIARQAWAGGVTDAVARALHGERGDLTRLATASANAEAFTAHAVGIPPGGMRPVTLPVAEAILQALDAGALGSAA